jgi:hypothetical protein
MAKPIKETPVLTGSDAVAFVDKMKAASNTTVTAKERARILENFAKCKLLPNSNALPRRIKSNPANS